MLMFKIFALKHSLQCWLSLVLGTDYNTPSRCEPKTLSKMHKFHRATSAQSIYSLWPALESTGRHNIQYTECLGKEGTYCQWMQQNCVFI